MRLLWALVLYIQLHILDALGDYQVLDKKLDFFEGRDACRELGPHWDLAMPHTAADLQIYDQKTGSEPCWIGVFKPTSNNLLWYYLDGENATQSHGSWNNGKPANDKAFCAYHTKNPDGWNEGECAKEEEKKAVCCGTTDHNAWTAIPDRSWADDREHGYHKIRYEATWVEGQGYCKNLGTGWDLAVQHREEDKARMLKETGGGRCWIGLSDRKEETSFLWVDTYWPQWDAWNENEPTSGDFDMGENGDEEDCVVDDNIDIESGWADVKCDKKYYVCCSKGIVMKDMVFNAKYVIGGLSICFACCLCCCFIGCTSDGQRIYNTAMSVRDSMVSMARRISTMIGFEDMDLSADADERESSSDGMAEQQEREALKEKDDKNKGDAVEGDVVNVKPVQADAWQE